MKRLARGVERLLGLPPNAINVYLVDDVLIDAATRLASRRILRQVVGRPVSMVALTHVHPDHQGAAHAVCEARGIPLACHFDGVDAMEGRKRVQQAGQSRAITRVIEWAFEGPPHPVRRPFAAGDEIAGRGVRLSGRPAGPNATGEWNSVLVSRAFRCSVADLSRIGGQICQSGPHPPT